MGLKLGELFGRKPTLQTDSKPSTPPLDGDLIFRIDSSSSEQSLEMPPPTFGNLLKTGAVVEITDFSNRGDTLVVHTKPAPQS